MKETLSTSSQDFRNSVELCIKKVARNRHKDSAGPRGLHCWMRTGSLAEEPLRFDSKLTSHIVVLERSSDGDIWKQPIETALTIGRGAYTACSPNSPVITPNDSSSIHKYNRSRHVVPVPLKWSYFLRILYLFINHLFLLGYRHAWACKLAISSSYLFVFTILGLYSHAMGLSVRRLTKINTGIRDFGIAVRHARATQNRKLIDLTITAHLVTTTTAKLVRRAVYM